MGLANMAQAAVAFTAILSVGGLGDVLLQRRRFEQEAGQAFWLSVFFSTLTALIIGGMAVIGSWFGKTQIHLLIWLLALNALVGAPATILAAGLKHRLDYKGLAFSQFVGGLFYTVGAVFLAWMGWGPFALIVTLIPKQIVTMIFMVWRGGAFKAEWPQWNVIQKLVKPTFSLGLSGLLVGLQTQAPIFICGVMLGAEKTGYFSWAWLVAGQVVFLLATNLREVLFPTLASISEDERRMVRAAQKGARSITAFLCVTCGLQSLWLPSLIGLFLPEKWHPAIPLAVIFTVGLITQGIWVSGMAFLNARGKYGPMLWISFSQVLINGFGPFLGAWTGGILGASIGCSVATFCGGLIYFFFIRGTNAPNYLRGLILPTFLSLAFLVLSFEISWGRGLLIQVMAGVLFVLLDGWVWWRVDKDSLREVFEHLAGKKFRLGNRLGEKA